MVLMEQIFVSTYIVIDFAVNQDYISANFCVQKDDQQGCNGKCHLSKTLKENITNESNSPQENTPRFLLKFDYLFFEKINKTHSLNFENIHIYPEWFCSKIVTRHYEVLTPPPDLV